jgi:hypothetical protein
LSMVNVKEPQSFVSALPRDSINRVQFLALSAWVPSVGGAVNTNNHTIRPPSTTAESRQSHAQMASTQTSSLSTPSYADCASVLRDSLSHLESSVSTLGTGVADFPRLVNVLKTVRVSPSPSRNLCSFCPHAC